MGRAAPRLWDNNSEINRPMMLSPYRDTSKRRFNGVC